MTKRVEKHADSRGLGAPGYIPATRVRSVTPGTVYSGGGPKPLEPLLAQYMDLVSVILACSKQEPFVGAWISRHGSRTRVRPTLVSWDTAVGAEWGKFVRSQPRIASEVQKEWLEAEVLGMSKVECLESCCKHLTEHDGVKVEVLASYGWTQFGGTLP
jgi:hypothetical protein